MPTRRFTPDVIAKETGKNEAEVQAILEAMADKGLCISFIREGTRYYVGLPLIPGILEYQFMRGTKTSRDYEIARAINAYRKTVVGSDIAQPQVTYPPSRIIPVNRVIKAEAEVQTYDQVLTYIEAVETISVATCYCRHGALLTDDNDVCGMPMEVCMQFNRWAEYPIERGIARRVSKEEAMDIIRRAEEVGLVHICSNNQTTITWLCSCCPCHCVIFERILRQPKPGEAVLHSFAPSFDSDLCTVCGICIDRCPTDALALGEGDIPEWDSDRCIGCGVCASGCQEDAVTLVEREGDFTPPVDLIALREATTRIRSETGSQ